MTDLMTLMKERRSIRKYRETPVTDLVLNQICEAIQWAPSWTNCQCWEVVVVRDPGVKLGLQDAIAPGNPARKSMVEAPVVLAVCAKKGVSGFYDGKPSTKFCDWFMFDLGLATQNLCLMAHSLGLGTVIAGLFDHDRVNGVLHVPEGFEAVALVPLGYPARESRNPGRREIHSFVHADRFGKRP